MCIYCVQLSLSVSGAIRPNFLKPILEEQRKSFHANKNLFNPGLVSRTMDPVVFGAAFNFPARRGLPGFLVLFLRKQLGVSSAKPVGHSRLPQMRIAQEIASKDPVSKSNGGFLQHNQSRCWRIGKQIHREPQ